jgi:uncharacterized membrane protein (DUF106 family)
MTEEEKEVNIPLKYNLETGKYEADKEALNERVEKINEKKSEEEKPEEIKNKQEESNEKFKEKNSNQEEKPKKEKKKSEGSFAPMIFIMLVSLVIAGLWDKVPAIKNTIKAGLDPVFGNLLNWNLTIGMLIIVALISVLTTIVQKYTTDQESLKDIKREQKEIQKEIKEHRKNGNQKKMMELNKKQMKLAPKQMKLSMKSVAYTGVPFILLIRWFQDYFANAGDPKFFGFMGWFIFYLLGAVIFGSILRKKMDVA